MAYGCHAFSRHLYAKCLTLNLTLKYINLSPGLIYLLIFKFVSLEFVKFMDFSGTTDRTLSIVAV